MQRQIALSYAIAGLAVAIAVVTAFGATTGVLAPRGPAAAEVALEATPPEVFDAQACVSPAADASATRGIESARDGALLADARAATAGEDVEVVYVDEPAPSRRGHEDDSDEDSEREERGERRDHTRGERGEYDERNERDERDDD